jgi:iron complex transport system permease protein
LRPSTRHIKVKLLVMLVLLPLFFVLCVSVGEISISFSDILKSLAGQEIENPSASVILYEFRIPEALTAVLCSGALALSGLIMQSYFRNPLAGPSVLGISSGSSFGIALLLVIFPQLLNDNQSSHLFLILFASLGALGVLAILSLIRFRIKNMETLLIAGLLIGYFLSACSTMLLSNTNAQNIKTYVYWGFGSFAKTGYGDIAVLASFIVILSVITLLMSRSLDVFQFSDDTIANTGINQLSAGYALMMLSGIICAVVTAYCGPVAFIGMCVPHVARMYLKTSRHFYLITGSILIAANIGLICTTVSRLSFFGQNLPLNSVTSFLGAPFILYILFSNRARRHA